MGKKISGASVHDMRIKERGGLSIIPFEDRIDKFQAFSGKSGLFFIIIAVVAVRQCLREQLPED